MLKEWGKTRTDLLTIQESPELPRPENLEALPAPVVTS